MVAGDVTPDVVVVDRAAGTLVSYQVGSKETMTAADGPADTPADLRSARVLSAVQAAELARIGLAAEKGAGPSANSDETAQQLAKSVDDLREKQAVMESQIATQDQAKVESESKYPVKVTGLVLFNGFVNTRQVDTPPDPTYALPGGGSMIWRLSVWLQP